jgi:diguanylate cyclase (GGDEF)-like protein/PAS domain S-box-containing protein
MASTSASQRDLTALPASASSPVEADDFLRGIVEAVSEPVFVKDPQHRFVLVNDACCELLGVERGELIGRERHGEASPADRRGEELILRGDGEQHASQILRDRLGRLHRVSVRKFLYRDAQGTPFIVGVMNDDPAGAPLARLLSYLLLHDRLTGLPSRALFEQQLRAGLERAQQEGTGLAVLSLDVDRLTAVNETLGHQAGDQLLVSVVRRLKSILRPQDPLARVGGDELCCLIERCETPGDAAQIAERIHRSLQRTFKVAGTWVRVTASVGIAWSAGAESAEDLLRFAEAALRRAKKAGGDTSRTFDPPIDGVSTERLHLQNELHQALRHGELALHYQPIVALDSGRIRGAEALVRWQHPVRGLVMPDHFIPLAEENGMIVPLGEWVLIEACRQVVRWERDGRIDDDFVINVNLSPRQLQEPGLSARIGEILRETGLPAHRLQLELTELAILKETAKACELRDLGIRLAIDDFGTGYASLASLRELPVNTLKIARTFISKLGDDTVDASLVRTILALVRDLNLACVAEGIETCLQWALLREMRCQLGQGFLFSRPLPGPGFEVLLAAEQAPSQDLQLAIA